ncbi:MAG: beta-ketoacyl-[acyl-carrier-protein] synthase family protein [Verrucomicrobia bacterium]|nr:beta-ketoacyl-[acyl-carrier-protein] synthase family protein [Verrucomicrobiota bacterium]
MIIESPHLTSSLPDAAGQHRRRVVVTGIGLLTPMGMGVSENAAGFRLGRPALRPITLFDTSRMRVHSGGELSLPGALPDTDLSPRETVRLDRSSKMLLHAAAEAMAQSDWLTEGKERSVALVFGTSAGAMALGEDFYRHALQSQSRQQQPSRIHGYHPQSQVLNLCRAFRLRGPLTVIANACASGANAIGHAASLIRNGRADRVLCGGYDALSELVFAGFDALQALSTTTPRPFDADRDGLALGEGAAVFTLESLESAQTRGAAILAEVAGYGMSTDVHHLTQPHPDGIAALQSMNAACADAGISPSQIGYINSHGTGTPLNDSAEANAITAWAGESQVKEIRVSSTKGGIGHLLGGAGAVEAAISILAMNGGWLPPNVQISSPDPAVAFDLVRSPCDASFDYCLTNSFGFGGANATVIFRGC